MDRSPNRRAGRPVLLHLLVPAFLLAAAPVGARADTPILPDGTIFTRAEAVVVGVVGTVEPGPLPGSQIALVAVEETIHGETPKAFFMEGSETDPSRPLFQLGARFLAFLGRTAVGDPAGGDPPSPPIPFAPLGGAQGMVDLGAADAAPARALTQAVLAAGGIPRLADLELHLGRGAAAPPVLLAAALEAAAAGLKPEDAGMLAAVACDGDGVYLEAASAWATERAGALRIAAVRPCLEARIASDPDLGRRAVAIEALGEIGDPGSLPALLQVLEPLTGRPGTRPARRSLGGLAEAAVLAIGKVGAVEAVPALMRIAFEGDDLALHSAVVHALGLIGGVGVTGALTEIGRTHPNGYVRDQALRTLERVRGGKDDGGES